MNDMITIIALTPSIDVDGKTSILESYVKAIEIAGGTPFLLPYTKDMNALNDSIKECQGVCFTGGIDIDPKRYNEEKMPCCNITQDNRDEFDLAIFDIAMKENKPIMGICRGAQLINVALGGTLYQDIPTDIKTDIMHKQVEPKFEHSHTVKILENTPLSKLFKEDEIKVNSFHHQAIKRLGKGLEIMALSHDGVIEAVFAPNYRYLYAYQWHPERLCHKDINHYRLFEDFIKACSNKE